MSTQLLLLILKVRDAEIKLYAAVLHMISCRLKTDLVNGTFHCTQGHVTSYKRINKIIQ